MSDVIEPLLQKGIKFHAAGQWDVASKIYTAILTARPEHAEANYNMGLLAMDAGNIHDAPTFLEKALISNADNPLHWINYTKALLKIGLTEDAAAVFDQAKNNGAKGEGFDELELQITKAKRTKIQSSYQETEERQPEANILDNLKLDQAIKLAKKKAKESSPDEAQQIYQDILRKYPKNKRAQDGTNSLVNGGVKKSSKIQDPPLDQLQELSQLYLQGKFQTARDGVEVLIQKYPMSAILFNLHGALHTAIGQHDLSVKAYKKALSIQPKYYDAYNNLGAAFEKLEKLDEAIAAFKQAVAIDPSIASAYNNMGIVLYKQGKLEEALKAYEKALAIQPNFAEAFNNLGNTLKKQKKFQESIEAYEKALNIKPAFFEALNNMGLALANLNKFDEAIEAYQKALTVNPDYFEAISNMGLALYKQGKLLEAVEAYQKALAIGPDTAEIYNDMAVALQVQNKTDEATEAFRKALTIKPDYAQCHQNFSNLLLHIDNIEEGLNRSEWRWQMAGGIASQRNFSQPVWNGKVNLDKKTILVWSEQGIGDIIKWSSRLSLVASKARHCIFECPEKLVPLLSRSFPKVEVRPTNRLGDATTNEFDFHLPIGSLYKHFITEITQNPRPDAFLVPDPVRVQFWKDRLNSLGHGPFVGISWKSSNMNDGRDKHFAPISEWSPLLKLPNITFVNLQYADAENDLLQIKNEFGVNVHNFDDLDQFNDLDNVAALSAALDHVVAGGTAVPMITAGVGTRTKWFGPNYVDNIYGRPAGPMTNFIGKYPSQKWSDVFELIATEINLNI